MIDEYFLHLRMQMGLWLFDEDEVCDRASCLCAVGLVIALKLQKHVNQVASTQTVIALGEMYPIRSGVNDFCMIRKKCLNIQGSFRTKLGVVEARKPKNFHSG
ncbi:hypothetical protein WJ63_26300 [Burkholderia pyrrocinia]|nr:hypothetical protein WJ63_26300 [Burkholderia pyrrocinia]